MNKVLSCFAVLVAAFGIGTADAATNFGVRGASSADLTGAPATRTRENVNYKKYQTRTTTRTYKQSDGGDLYYSTPTKRSDLYKQYDAAKSSSAKATKTTVRTTRAEKIVNKLNRKYYGASVKVDKEIGLEWARIPHFYSAFYVYQYTTGFSSAALIANEIQAGAPDALDRYLQFLSSGGRDYPIELLKIAGVDLSTPKPVEAALGIFQEYVKQLEEAFRE